MAVIDMHVHLLGAGDDGSGCYFSPRMRRSFIYRYLLRRLGLTKAPSIDQGYLEVLVESVRTSSVDLAVIYAQDAVYDDRGRHDHERTPLYVPNSYVFEVAGRYPFLLPGASINPMREDVLDELDLCAERGAVLVKVHPNIQGVDLSDRRHLSFLKRLRELGLPLVVHTGHEHGAQVVSQSLGDPSRLEPALREGLTVVAAHCGSSGIGASSRYYARFAQMVHEHENLYGDSAAIADLLRWPTMHRIVRDDAVLSRLLHGSDFPVPSAPLSFGRIGLRDAWRFLKEKNLVERDYRIKRAWGVPEAVFERAWTVLSLARHDRVAAQHSEDRGPGPRE